MVTSVKALCVVCELTVMSEPYNSKLIAQAVGAPFSTFSRVPPGFLELTPSEPHQTFQTLQLLQITTSPAVLNLPLIYKIIALIYSLQLCSFQLK